ncbi:MAG TPA: peptidoglycan editing factor PgeF [Caulobacteraceae bacterium]
MTAPPVLQSSLLAEVAGVRHAFFTRAGGVSGGVFESLNVGVGSTDDPAAVAENRRRAAAWFGAAPEALATCYQVHSARVITAEGSWRGDRPEADGVVTKISKLICGALAADCAPVLLADGEARIVAAVHAGWRGALAGVVGEAVEAMIGLGATRARVAAAVGPCIGPASYEVGMEFLAAFEGRDPAFARFFAPGAAADKRRFDLPGFVLSRLEAAGVGKREWIGADTFAEETQFFSNRRAFHRGETDYGRLLSGIMLEG